MGQERIRRERPTHDRAQESAVEPTSHRTEAVAAKGRETKQEIDALLDEIDAVLEANAYEIVESYVQKSGE
jgi:ubiquitin-like protein Pup